MIKKNNQGFTIIEVVLVLAIAGLIFAMVFIALPAMNRGQRDTARRNDVSTVASALNTYRSNHKGSFNNLDSAKLQKYIDSLNQYNVSDVEVVTASNRLTATKAKIRVMIGKKCGDIPVPAGEADQTMTMKAGTARSASVVAFLENNGSKYQIYCQDV